MVRILGLFFLLPFSLAARIHGPVDSRSIQKRPPVDGVRDQQEQNAGQVLRLPMSRRPPRLANTPPTITRRSNQALFDLHHSSSSSSSSSSHRHSSKTSSSSSAKPSPTVIAANTSAFFVDAAYGIDVWIGNYPQRVTLDFDTGSSETWASPPCSEWAPYPEYEDLCRMLGTYVPEQSATGIPANCTPGWIMYGSGAVYLKYYTDDMQFSDPYDDIDGGLTSDGIFMKQVQFGVAVDATNMPSGIFGAAYGVGYNQDYPAVIDEMFNQSLIASKDFSVALGSIGKEAGEIVFGGIDLAKFSGPLHEYEVSHQLPKTVDGYYRYWINISSIGITEPDTCVTLPLLPKDFNDRFLPDTGTSLTYMPTDAFNGILNAFPDAQLSMGYGYMVNCSHKERKGTIDYTFADGFTVHVPYSEFIFLIPAGPSNGPEDVCILGAVPTDELFILGDTFLRSVYAVFSQERHKIYFADYKDCGSHTIPSRGEKNKGLLGKCPPDERDAPKGGDQHDYGHPSPSSSSAEAENACTSYSTAPHPKPSKSSTSRSKDDTFWTEGARNPRLLRPMIQTAARPDLPPPGAPTSVRTGPHPPWSGNATATERGTAASVSGHAGSSGFRPPTVPTGTASPRNTSEVNTATFEPVTLSNSTVGGITSTLNRPSTSRSSSSSTRLEVPSSAGRNRTTSSTSTHFDVSTSTSSSKIISRVSVTSAKSSWLTPFPQPASSSKSCSSSRSVSTEWFTVLSRSTSDYGSLTSTSSGSSSNSETPSVSVVTIPVQPDETIVVRLDSTTYTIVDGTTLSGADVAGSSSGSSITTRYSSLTRHVHPTTTTSTSSSSDESGPSSSVSPSSSDSLGPVISWETLTWTKLTTTSSSTLTSSSSSSKKRKTQSTSASTSTNTGKRTSSSSPSSSSITTSTHKKKTTTTSSSSWSSELPESSFPFLSTSIGSYSTITPDKYLTSWAWDPTGTSELDPFYTSVSDDVSASVSVSSSTSYEVDPEPVSSIVGSDPSDSSTSESASASSSFGSSVSSVSSNSLESFSWWSSSSDIIVSTSISSLPSSSSSSSGKIRTTRVSRSSATPNPRIKTVTSITTVIVTRLDMSTRSNPGPSDTSVSISLTPSSDGLSSTTSSWLGWSWSSSNSWDWDTATFSSPDVITSAESSPSFSSSSGSGSGGASGDDFTRTSTVTVTGTVIKTVQAPIDTTPAPAPPNPVVRNRDTVILQRRNNDRIPGWEDAAAAEDKDQDIIWRDDSGIDDNAAVVRTTITQACHQPVVGNESGSVDQGQGQGNLDSRCIGDDPGTGSDVDHGGDMDISDPRPDSGDVANRW